jgi:hypothetical protein
VPIAGPALAALRRWDRLRVERIGGPRSGSQAAERWPLFCTVGRRRRQGGYMPLGGVFGDVVAKLVARHGHRAEIDAELRHAHVLRHTDATRYLQFEADHRAFGPRSKMPGPRSPTLPTTTD